MKTTQVRIPHIKKIQTDYVYLEVGSRLRFISKLCLWILGKLGKFKRSYENRVSVRTLEISDILEAISAKLQANRLVWDMKPEDTVILIGYNQLDEINDEIYGHYGFRITDPNDELYGCRLIIVPELDDIILLSSNALYAMERHSTFVYKVT